MRCGETQFESTEHERSTRRRKQHQQHCCCKSLVPAQVTNANPKVHTCSKVAPLPAVCAEVDIAVLLVKLAEQLKRSCRELHTVRESVAESWGMDGAGWAVVGGGSVRGVPGVEGAERAQGARRRREGRLPRQLQPTAVVDASAALAGCFGRRVLL
eukprot:2234924-Rhodomonas_salina.1